MVVDRCRVLAAEDIKLLGGNVGEGGRVDGIAEVFVEDAFGDVSSVDVNCDR